MTIKLLSDLYGLYVGDNVSGISYAIEDRLIEAGLASRDLSATGATIELDLSTMNPQQAKDYLEAPITPKPNYRYSADATRFVEARRRLDAVYSREVPLNYIVTGDSTRDNTYNGMLDYYETMLSQIGVEVVDNAASGQSGQNWADSIGSATLAQAIAATPNTGYNTIMEYSFGINDLKNGATEAEVKAWLKDGIVAYLFARPNATVILVEPVPTSNATRNAGLAAIYAEIADELSLPLIVTSAIMGAVYDATTDNVFYVDGTHPSAYGSMRLVHWILSEMLPAHLYSVVTIGEVPVPPEATVTYNGYRDGEYYSSSTGAFVTSGSASDWTCLEPIAVDGAQTIRVLHGGTRWDAKFMDANGDILPDPDGSVTLSAVSGESYRETDVPDQAVEMRLNISNIASYDPTVDTITVEYVIATIAPPTLDEINVSMSNRLQTA